MKKFVFASLTVALIGAASASETGDGVHTYRYQSSTRPSVTHHVRAIPGPSSWTPPERVPSAPVRLWKKDQPKRLTGGNSFSSPSFTPAQFSNSAFSNPTFNAPTFNAPSFTAPQYSGNQSSGAPTYNSPNFTAPSFNQANFSAPTRSF